MENKHLYTYVHMYTYAHTNTHPDSQLLREATANRSILLNKVLEDQLVDGITQDDLDLFAQAQRISNPVSIAVILQCLRLINNFY